MPTAPGRCQGPQASSGWATSLVGLEAANAETSSGMVSEPSEAWAEYDCTCPVVRRQRSKEQGMK